MSMRFPVARYKDGVLTIEGQEQEPPVSVEPTTAEEEDAQEQRLAFLATVSLVLEHCPGAFLDKVDYYPTCHVLHFSPREEADREMRRNFPYNGNCPTNTTVFSRGFMHRFAGGELTPTGEKLTSARTLERLEYQWAQVCHHLFPDLMTLEIATPENSYFIVPDHPPETGHTYTLGDLVEYVRAHWEEYFPHRTRSQLPKYVQEWLEQTTNSPGPSYRPMF